MEIFLISLPLGRQHDVITEDIRKQVALQPQGQVFHGGFTHALKLQPMKARKRTMRS